MEIDFFVEASTLICIRRRRPPRREDVTDSDFRGGSGLGGGGGLGDCNAYNRTIDASRHGGGGVQTVVEDEDEDEGSVYRDKITSSVGGGVGYSGRSYISTGGGGGGGGGRLVGTAYCSSSGMDSDCDYDRRCASVKLQQKSLGGFFPQNSSFHYPFHHTAGSAAGKPHDCIPPHPV